MSKFTWDGDFDLVTQGDTVSKGSRNQPRVPAGSPRGGEWTSVRVGAGGFGQVEQTAEGGASYAGVTDKEWSIWAEAEPEVNEAVAGTLKVGSVDSYGETVTVKDVAEYKSIGERIQVAAESHLAGRPGQVFWRGESFDSEQQMFERLKNKKIEMPKLISVGHSRDIAENYAGSVEAPVQAIIRVQNGKSGIRGIQTAPMGVPSNEIVLPKGETFRSTYAGKEGAFHIFNWYSTEKHGRLTRVENTGPPIAKAGGNKFVWDGDFDLVTDAAPVTKAAPRPRATHIWQTIHGVADRMYPRVRKAFLLAVQWAWQSNIGTLANIEDAIRSQSTDQIINALNGPKMAADFEYRLRSGEFMAALTTTYQTAGEEVMPAVIAQLQKQTSVPFTLRFNLQNPRSVEFLKNYDGTLIREMGDEQRRAIIAVVKMGLEGGKHPYDTARQIRKMENFGLTSRQNQAVNNVRTALAEAGVAGPKLEKQVAAYQTKLLRYRSELIARTETIRAAEAGHQESWEQAADEGLFDRDSGRRFWVVTPDDRLCENCRAIPGMNPNGVALRADFKTPYGPRARSPAHPGCRCSIVLRFPEE